MRSLAVPGDLGRQEVAWGLATRLQRVKSEKRTKWDWKAGESVVKPPGGEGGLRACVQSHPGGVEDFFLREGALSQEGGDSAEEPSSTQPHPPHMLPPVSGTQGHGPDNIRCLRDLCFPTNNQIQALRNVC